MTMTPLTTLGQDAGAPTLAERAARDRRLHADALGYVIARMPDRRAYRALGLVDRIVAPDTARAVWAAFDEVRSEDAPPGQFCGGWRL